MSPRPGECTLHTLKALLEPCGRYSASVPSVCHICYVDLGDDVQHHLAKPAMIPACYYQPFDSLVCLLRTRSFHSRLACIMAMRDVHYTVFNLVNHPLWHEH